MLKKTKKKRKSDKSSDGDKHPKSDNEIRNEQIAILSGNTSVHPDMGYRRIRDELAINYGIPANDKRIRERRKMNTVIYQMEAEELYESRQESLPHCKNFLHREFHADKPMRNADRCNEFKYYIGVEVQKYIKDYSAILV